MGSFLAALDSAELKKRRGRFEQVVEALAALDDESLSEFKTALQTPIPAQHIKQAIAESTGIHVSMTTVKLWKTEQRWEDIRD